MSESYELAEDLIWGAKDIGKALGLTPRQIYHMADQQYLPVVRIGSTLACRRSVLMQYFIDREAKNASTRRGLGQP